MGNFKIGVMNDSFRLPLRDGLRTAAAIGAQGVQMYAVDGELSPKQVTPTLLREIKSILRDLGLEVSAVCGDLGGHGFTLAQDNKIKIEKTKRIIDLTKELGSTIVTTHIGVVPAHHSSDTYKVLKEACYQLGSYAASMQATLAIETGPETSVRLKLFLDDVAQVGLGVNMDPANLVMVTGDDPVQAVYTLGKYIVHTHAKDGVKFNECDPVVVYDAFARGGIVGLNIGELFNEVPLGTGGVDFPRYLKALNEVGYSGYLTIEREVGFDPVNDIRMAVEYLKKQIKDGHRPR